MTAAEQVKTALIAALEDAGLAAVGAWEEERLRHWPGCVTAVGAEKTALRQTGLLDYLGETFDEARGTTAEVYGRTMTMTLSLDVYTPRELGAAAGEAAAEQATQALTARLPSGLRAQEICWEGSAWDRASGMFRKRGSAEFTALFTASAAEDEAVLSDFILKGAVRG